MTHQRYNLILFGEKIKKKKEDIIKAKNLKFKFELFLDLYDSFKFEI